MRVSIRIPAYNAAGTILDTVRSLLSQTYQDVHIYIYDNASTDDTVAIIESISDSRVSFLPSQVNKGWNFNFNRCLEPCDDEFLLIAHADDIYHPLFIERNIECILSSKARLLFSTGIQFRKVKDIVQREIIPKELELTLFDDHESLLSAVVKKGNFLFCPTAFGRSNDFVSLVKFFDGNNFGGSADLDAWLRFSRTHPIGVIEEKGLFFHRLSESQISYHDLGLQNSVFVKCCKSHIDNSAIDPTQKIELHLYMIFHELTYRALAYLSSPEAKYFFKYHDLVSLAKIKIGFLKKLKLISLVLLCKSISYVPINGRKSLAKFLLRIARRS